MGVSKFSVKVDKRIELLSAVQLFTSWRKIGIWEKNYKYLEDMENFFKPYSEYKAIKLCEKLIQTGFNFDAPVGFMMHLSEPPELSIVVPFSEYHVRRAKKSGGSLVLNEFVGALRDFSTKSNFEDFWNSHIEFYKKVEEIASSNIKLEDTVRKLEQYFGLEQEEYHVILAPVFLGNYGYSIKVNSKSIIYAFLCPREVKENTPIFEAALFHEFAHSFVNPITEKFRKEVDETKTLSEPIMNRMRKLAYGDWITVVNEHIIRAIEPRVYPDEIYIVDSSEKMGFIYIRPIFNLLTKYEQNRNQYRTFEDFYPEIVNLLKSIADAFKALKEITEPPKTFKGPIDAVFDYEWYLNKIVIVVPTGIKDEQVRNNIEKYIDDIRSFLEKKLSIKVPKVKDIEALNINLSDKVIIVYGNPNSNMLLSKLIEKLPFKVLDDKIILGKKTYTGSNLKFITVFQNPENKALPILLYISTKDEGLIGIHSIFHGPTDYILCKDGEVVAQGYYVKNENWEFPE